MGRGWITPSSPDRAHTLRLLMLLPFKYWWPGSGREWAEVHKQGPSSPQTRHSEPLSLPRLSSTLTAPEHSSLFASCPPASLQLL